MTSCRSIVRVDALRGFRPDEAVVKSFHWDVVVDFEAKVLRGHVDLNVVRSKPDAEWLLLDSSKDLNVKDALCAKSGQKLDMDRSVTDQVRVSTTDVTSWLEFIKCHIFVIAIFGKLLKTKKKHWAFEDFAQYNLCLLAFYLIDFHGDSDTVQGS